MAVRWSSKWRWNTEYSADSVEWCPVEPFQDIMVCGTYQLEKKDEGDQQLTKQKRLGRIYLFEINEDTSELNPIQTLDTSGILDQKWCYHTIQGYPVLAVVTSEGLLQLYQLLETNGIRNLKLWIEYSIGQDVLALSLDWSTNKAASDEPMVVVSDSAGSVTLLKIGAGIQKIETWNSHGFEAWIAAFDYWNTNVFYSGGDDCLFKSYDVRVPDAAVTTSRAHEAGVTAIRSHADVAHQLLTGSYDEKARLWDTRSLKRCVSETPVGGGVWRLKWHPTDPGTVLAACMYGGFRVLGVKDPEISVLCEYLEHESIAYGADWKFNQPGLVATCSFYDCSLHISQIDITH